MVAFSTWRSSRQTRLNGGMKMLPGWGYPGHDIRIGSTWAGQGDSPCSKYRLPSMAMAPITFSRVQDPGHDPQKRPLRHACSAARSLTAAAGLSIGIAAARHMTGSRRLFGAATRGRRVHMLAYSCSRDYPQGSQAVTAHEHCSPPMGSPASFRSSLMTMSLPPAGMCSVASRSSQCRTLRSPRCSGPFDARAVHCITIRGDQGHRVGSQSML